MEEDDPTESREDRLLAAECPVHVGDLLLLDPSQTGLSKPAWAIAEIVEHHPRPGDLPWNIGDAFPFRIAYRIDEITPGTGPQTRLGVAWLTRDGHDARGLVRLIDHHHDMR